MRIPYIKIKQKNEVFFVTKFKAKELQEKVNFHFRDPYSDETQKIILYKDYISKLEKKGITIIADQEGVQRRLQISRINKIKEYLEKEMDSYFPTSIVLAVDVSVEENFLYNYEEIEDNEFGEIELSDDVTFQIVDGQHRLAGLFISDDAVIENFELSAVLLFNATSHTCAKIFADINGNQAKVSKSVIYDLYDLMDVDKKEEILMKSLHNICNKLNTDSESPLYRHIKMLGIGQGAISQAFFMQYLRNVIKELNWEDESQQFIYENLFLYLKCFQRIFCDVWPVLEPKCYMNNQEFFDYSNLVLKVQKSQILKTNGFGAIMLLMPNVVDMVGSDCSYKNYYKILESLKGKMDWINDDTIKQGTGKKTQNAVKQKMLSILNENL